MKDGPAPGLEGFGACLAWTGSLYTVSSAQASAFGVHVMISPDREGNLFFLVYEMSKPLPNIKSPLNLVLVSFEVV